MQRNPSMVFFLKIPIQKKGRRADSGEESTLAFPVKTVSRAPPWANALNRRQLICIDHDHDVRSYVINSEEVPPCERQCYLHQLNVIECFF